MKEPLLNIGKIHWVNYYYKTGFKIAFEYKGWDDLQERLKHKRGRKPLGFQFFSDKGVYLLSMEMNYKEKV